MSKSNGNRKKLLIGAKEIMCHCGMSESVFYNFIRLGMPVRKINNRLYAHVENIDHFLRKITLGPSLEVPDDPIDDLEQNDV